MKDLTGEQFGRWTVIGKVCVFRRTRYLCLCSCGVLRIVRARGLITKTSKSCGCLQKEIASKLGKKKIKDLKNKKFNRLTVVKISSKRIRGRIAWECRCDCGNIVTLTTNRLTSGNTKSCGCYKIDTAGHKREEHWNWKGGLESINHAIRKLPKYKNWRSLVFKRDKFVCCFCHLIGRRLNAHHIKSLAYIIRENNITTLEEAKQCVELWNTDNGITLCKSCHDHFHGKV